MARLFARLIRFIPLSWWLTLGLIWSAFNPCSVGEAAPEDNRLRVIIETDAGGDPDDEQSLVRFLLYANEWDIEGIVANRPRTSRPENKNPEPTDVEFLRKGASPPDGGR